MTAASASMAQPGGAGRGRVGGQDRLLVEMVRVREQLEGRGLGGAEAAEATARDVGGSFDTRLVARARALPEARVLTQAVQRTGAGMRALVGVALLAAALAGFGAAGAALQPTVGDTVNIYPAMVGLLGVQMVMLLGWAALMLVRRGRGLPLKHITEAIGAGAARLLRDRGAGAAATAVSARLALLAGHPAGRWQLSAMSHAMWAAFNLGCLVGVTLLLSVRQYTFAWETTILSPEAFVRLTQAIATGPGALGWPVPTTEQVVASQRVVGADGAGLAGLAGTAGAWAGLLVGSLVVYGFMPRVALLTACVLTARYLAARRGLDGHWPAEYRAALRGRLSPATRSLGVIDPPAGEETAAADVSEEDGEAPLRPLGPPAIVGFEIEPPATDWPPTLPGSPRIAIGGLHPGEGGWRGWRGWWDLGLVEDRVDRTRVLAALIDAEHEPRVTVVVCSLTSTPDRGTRRFIEQVRRRLRQPMVLLLTGGHAVRERDGAEAVAPRVTHWAALARDAGVAGAEGHVLELDLDHATEASLHRLTRLLVGDDDAMPPGVEPGRDRLAAAFERIGAHVGRWSAAPDAEARARLHRDIAACYRERAADWPRVVDDAGRLAEGWPAQVRDRARHVVELLPVRLRVSPRWLVAGAAAGALGCVAAAAMISPLALLSMPTFSIIGAAAGAVFPAALRGGATSDAGGGTVPGDDYRPAVEAAALYAMLLDLQGLDEARISAVLDEALPEASAGEPLRDADAARSSLDELQLRFERARGGGAGGERGAGGGSGGGGEASS
ncbi:MAG: DUF2868 domain-containing protein [Phycisphaeraceae bacterium]